MLLFFVSCMMGNLAGDSVYQGTENDIPSVNNGSEGSLEEEFTEDPQESTTDLMDLEYSEAESLNEGSMIVVDVLEEGIDVVHTNIYLGCDMSPFTPEVLVEGTEIFISYMPSDEERACIMDVHFSMNLQMEEGTYTLNIMEDTADFVYGEQ